MPRAKRRRSGIQDNQPDHPKPSGYGIGHLRICEDMAEHCPH